MENSRFIAKHVINLPKSGIRDFFEIVAKMRHAVESSGVLESVHNPYFNCGGFAIIKSQAAALIPSNSMGLGNGLGLRFSFNPVEFDGIRIFKGHEFETFRNRNHAVFDN